LVNVWDEICVQVQGEHSAFWDAYDQTARDMKERSARPICRNGGLAIATPPLGCMTRTSLRAVSGPKACLTTLSPTPKVLLGQRVTHLEPWNANACLFRGNS